LPISLDGKIRSQAEKVKAFIDMLTAAVKIPLEYRDERLSTRSAQRLMRESHHKKTSLKTRDDANAAAVILQGYLDEKMP
jgi:putative holliday junction resolvase